MVDFNRIQNKITQLEEFFSRIKDSSLNSVDVESASYGLSKVKFIKNALEKYHEKNQSKLLREIYSAFTSITRGVEYFKDYDANLAFNELCGGIYQIQEDIKANTKW
jgi:hypothetical protein